MRDNKDRELYDEKELQFYNHIIRTIRISILSSYLW